MGLDKLDSNMTKNDVVYQEQKPVKKQDTTPKVVPVVEEKVSQDTDLEKPVEGYAIEKTSQEPVTEPEDKKDDKDDIDTSIDPNARITLLPSIAINKTTNEITNAMEQAVNRAMTEKLQSSSEDSYIKAQSMVQDNHSYKCFDEINYTKRFNIYGKVIYEGNFQDYTDNSLNSEIKLSRNSEKCDLGLNWKNKSGNTKIFAFGSFTHTNQKISVFSTDTDTDQNLSLKPLDNSTEQLDSQVDIEGSYKDNSYSVYGAAQHKFKTGDILTGGGYHINDAIHEIKTTSFDASYYYRKFMVLAEGKTTIFKLLNDAPVTKTDFSISLNPELVMEPKKEEAKPVAEIEAETEAEMVPEQEQVTKPNKKWSTNLSPFFDTQTIKGDTEEGLGFKIRLKRTDDSSNFRFGSLGKISTTHTQQEESNKYHVTFGSCVKYNKNITSTSNISAEAEIKDRVTFGEGNILTASAHALYTSPKITLEAEAKRILISGNQPSYSAVVGRAYYTPTNNVNLYAETSYTNLKEQDTNLKGTNIQAGVIVNF